MAGGRRGLARNILQKVNPPSFDSFRNNIDRLSDTHSVAYLKHVPIPDVSQESDWSFEAFVFGYNYLGMVLQYLHLYRTVWWLPHSYTRYAVNFYLIDPYLVFFVGVLLAVRLLWSFVRRIVAAFVTSPTSGAELTNELKSVRYVLVTALGSLLLWSGYFIVQNHPVITIVCLCYPLLVYLILFGPVLEPLVQILPTYKGTSVDRRNKFQQNGVVQHFCHSSADDVRAEVTALKADFNERIKRSLLSSLLGAYCAGFIPCCFSQSYLHYDITWVTQHLIFLWLGSLTMHMLYCFPPRYCDILHRAALHLGKWIKLEGRPSHLPYSQWTESTLWAQGSLVKYQRELYRAETICTAAEPGNNSHTRFYIIFNNSSLLLCGVLGLQLSLVFLQVIELIRSSNWERLLSLTLLLFANYVTMFRLARGYLLLWKTHRFEHIIQNQQNAVNSGTTSNSAMTKS